MKESRLKRNIYIALAIAIIAVLLIALTPEKALLVFQKNATGWSLNTRPISAIGKFTGKSASLEQNLFELNNKYVNDICPKYISQHYGIFAIRHYYSWHNTVTSQKQCANLINQYKNTQLDKESLNNISALVGAQMLAKYHTLAKDKLADKVFSTRAEEDRFYNNLQFNQQTVAMPALPYMFFSLLKNRPTQESVCAALDIMPWMLSHDKAMAGYTKLAKAWHKLGIQGTDYLQDPYSCSPALLMPPSLFAQETKERNQFLEQTGLNCHMLTPKGQYVYAQQVICDDK